MPCFSSRSPSISARTSRPMQGGRSRRRPPARGRGSSRPPASRGRRRPPPHPQARRAGPPEFERPGDERISSRFGEVLERAGLDDARRDSVDADPRRCQLDREVADERLERGLRDADQRVPGEDPLRSERGDPDDRRARRHLRRGGLRRARAGRVRWRRASSPSASRRCRARPARRPRPRCARGDIEVGRARPPRRARGSR